MIIELSAVSIVTIVGLYIGLRCIWPERGGIADNPIQRNPLSSKSQVGNQEGAPTENSNWLNRVA